MDFLKENMDIIIVFGGILLLFLIMDFVFRFIVQSKSIKYVKMEMKRAYTKKEFNYWKKELHNIYLCLIPGLNPVRVKKLRKLFSRKKKS